MKDPIKVYDARWEATEFTDAQVKRLFESTLIYAFELGVRTVVFGRDARLAAGHVMEIGVETALAAGFRTIVNPDPISTPQSYFNTLHYSQENPNTIGLTVTASHNPSQYVGVKFVVPVVHAIGFDCGPSGGLRRVREIYHSNARLPTTGGGKPELINLQQNYIDFSLQTAGVSVGGLSGMKIVLDAFNGSAGPEIFQALTRAGADVSPLRLIPDGTFPTGSPNPTSQGKMNNAIELAQEIGAQLVIGVDGDGDRIVFGDRRGLLTAGFAFVPILKACLEGTAPGQTALYDPKVSPLALAEWGKLGATPVLFRNGHSQIKDYMSQTRALAAAEESGHYYHRIQLNDLVISGENSILTILLLAKALQADRTLMDRLWDLQNQIVTTGEFNYQFPDDSTRDQALKNVIEHFKTDKAIITTHTPDGIDLEGTCVNKGVDLKPGAVKLADGWYSGYFRVATNEKGVVRGYLTAGETATGKAVEDAARSILGQKFSGKVVE